MRTFFNTLMSRPITLSIVAYWGMFWLLNAADKVFAQRDLGIVMWWGNHRTEKFTMYFERLGWGPEGVNATLLFAGVAEVAVAAMFVYAAIGIFRGTLGAVRRVDMAIAASIAIFFGFAVFDVIVGDRAELLEHSTYVGVLLISFLAVAAEVFFGHLKAMTLEAATPETRLSKMTKPNLVPAE